MQCVKMKQEIISHQWKSKRVEVNLLKSAHQQEQNLEMLEASGKAILRSKWEGLQNLTEIGITEGYENFPNSTNMDTP